MIISLPSSFPSILFRFRFIFGWCRCIGYTNCWFPFIDDCWGWLLIDTRDLWIFLVFFLYFLSLFDYSMVFFFFFFFHKDSIFLSFKFILCFLVTKKKKSSFEKHAIIFHSVCRFKKKKGFWFLGSRMNKNSWFQIMEYFIILISFLMIMKDRETYTKSMYINLNLGEVQHSNRSF